MAANDSGGLTPSVHALYHRPLRGSTLPQVKSWSDTVGQFGRKAQSARLNQGREAGVASGGGGHVAEPVGYPANIYSRGGSDQL